MFESDETIAEKQSDKFNVYEDSLEDISEMSDNTEDSKEILLTAEQSETDDILEDNNLDKNTTINMQYF
ncbi:hypothetical protein BDDG_12871 [Blastomyces dermatitidis ATCC 18188]|uniref:Uncharacterized protein n=1 Tax=Ajellomyces dermatitidis (strain ATCC 18188 / CBS 674.68) TaxID=653446 RepID=A0A0J9ER49_AJEDA|nr:hypothetical protein BDDG_12871 [Blastomyces dermatitidis ATCC 18188]